MELRLYFEDYENAVKDDDGDSYSVPTIKELIADPDDEAIRHALLRMAEKSEMDPVAVLVHANGRDFVQFYILDKKEPAAPFTNDGIKGRRDSPGSSPPPVPEEEEEEGEEEYVKDNGEEEYQEEETSSQALPADLCHVEYCKSFPGKKHAQFFTEELTLPDVLEILQLFLEGDPSWQNRREWRKLVWAGPEAKGDFRSKFGSLALATAFIVGCLATPFWFARALFFLFAALLTWNAFRSIGYATGAPWRSGDDARWDFYDDGEKATKKKWKPPSGKEVSAWTAKYGCTLIYVLATVFFIIYGISSGSCRNGFNRKAPARPPMESKAGDGGGLRSPDKRTPTDGGGGQAIKPGDTPGQEPPGRGE